VRKREMKEDNPSELDFIQREMITEIRTKKIASSFFPEL
jgi:hypothetical protein